MKALLDHCKVRCAITQMNLKQEEFAEKISVSDRHVRNLCKRDVEVAVSLLYRVGTVFLMPPEALLILKEDND